MSSKANSPSRTSLSLSSKKSFRNDLLISVAMTGDAGSYTSSAAKTFFSPYSTNINYNAVSNLRELLESIKRGENIYGITPLESSSFGTIHAVYDRLLLSQGRFTIVGEIGQIEEHCLCVRNDFTGTEVDISRIFSHPHIMECCSDSLDAIDKKRSLAGLDHIRRENSWDSIAACRDVLKADAIEAVACICSREAAELNDLKVLNQSIGNYKNAEVRQ
jgi:chorismate mutase/prephenate dehydratase